MAGEFTTIDPIDKKVFFGTIPITGFASGKKIGSKLTDDDWVTMDGTDGDVTRMRVRKDTGECSVFLSQGSITNTILATARAVDLSTGAGVFPFTIVDKGGKTLIAAKKAWIKKGPDYNESDTIEIREWVFQLVGVKETYFVGGANA
jgi:hypothetical protein